jgi:hypothetical protein
MIAIHHTLKDFRLSQRFGANRILSQTDGTIRMYFVSETLYSYGAVPIDLWWCTIIIGRNRWESLRLEGGYSKDLLTVANTVHLHGDVILRFKHLARSPIRKGKTAFASRLYE